MISISESILEQFYDVYINEKWWDKHYLDKTQYIEYCRKLCEQGNIFWETDNNILVGYTEVWLINYEQLGRIVCHEEFDASKCDILSGDIAYLANVWCKKEYRRGDVIKTMKEEFFNRFMGCEYFVAHSIAKKHSQPIKVYKMNELIKGAKYGRF